MDKAIVKDVIVFLSLLKAYKSYNAKIEWGVKYAINHINSQIENMSKRNEGVYKTLDEMQSLYVTAAEASEWCTNQPKLTKIPRSHYKDSLLETCSDCQDVMKNSERSFLLLDFEAATRREYINTLHAKLLPLIKSIEEEEYVEMKKSIRNGQNILRELYQITQDYLSLSLDFNKTHNMTNSRLIKGVVEKEILGFELSDKENEELYIKRDNNKGINLILQKYDKIDNLFEKQTELASKEKSHKATDQDSMNHYRGKRLKYNFVFNGYHQILKEIFEKSKELWKDVKALEFYRSQLSSIGNNSRKLAAALDRVFTLDQSEYETMDNKRLTGRNRINNEVDYKYGK